MAGLLNPQFGQSPGAPYGLHYWDGNRFVLADFPPPPAAPASPPAPPMAATITPQDVQTHQAAANLSGGGGDNGGGATRDQQGPNAGNPFGGFANPFAGTANATPANFNSNYGLLGSTLGGAAGLAAGVPGLGMVGGALGQMADANRYSGVLNANNVPMSPNYMSAALAGASSLPFGLGNLFGTSARQQSEDARRSALANGVITGNTMDFDAAPAAPAYDAREQGGYNNENNAQGWGLAERAAADMAAAGLGGIGGPAAGGQQGVDPTGPGGFGSPGPGMDAGGFGPGAGAGPDIGGAFGPGFKGGGTVPHPMPGMMDPPGPDDQVAGLQSGEGVLTRAAMKRHPGLLHALNKGDIKRARGLLNR